MDAAIAITSPPRSAIGTAGDAGWRLPAAQIEKIIAAEAISLLADRAAITAALDQACIVVQGHHKATRSARPRIAWGIADVDLVLLRSVIRVPMYNALLLLALCTDVADITDGFRVLYEFLVGLCLAVEESPPARLVEGESATSSCTTWEVRRVQTERRRTWP